MKREKGTPAADGPRASVNLTRCAIYMRKSTEEGLDQEYNSLDAQRDGVARTFGVRPARGGRWSPTGTPTAG